MTEVTEYFKDVEEEVVEEPAQAIPTRTLVYLKDSALDLDKGFIDESCFLGKSEDEINALYSEEGYEICILEKAAFAALLEDNINYVEIKRVEKLSSRKEFLNSGDWRIVKAAELKTEVSDVVLAIRAQARAEYNAIELESTIEALES